ncbi:MAG: SMC-Scp complex subunit ScpB [Candidatus Micrarchaeota archaeon]|nr:SMC-Scp complex subunit ScpB [Candidatus Micrarchaeota archaeon]
MNEDSGYKRVAEAALFASGRAMSAQELAAVMGVASMGYVKSVMESLIQEYSQREGALEVKAVGDGYVLEVKNEYAQKVASLAGSPDISRPSLRILAYISKNEPVMQSAIVKAFGSSAYDHIKELTEKQFIKSSREGRTKRIETSPKFREYFEL